jgi:hypothetical protein
MPSIPKSADEINKIYKKILILRSLFNASAITKKNSAFCKVLLKKVTQLILKLLLIKIEKKDMIKKTKIARLIFVLGMPSRWIIFLSIKHTIAKILRLSIIALEMGRK